MPKKLALIGPPLALFTSLRSSVFSACFEVNSKVVFGRISQPDRFRLWVFNQQKERKFLESGAGQKILSDVSEFTVLDLFLLCAHLCVVSAWTD